MGRQVRTHDHPECHRPSSITVRPSNTHPNTPPTKIIRAMWDRERHARELAALREEMGLKLQEQQVRVYVYMLLVRGGRCGSHNKGLTGLT